MLAKLVTHAGTREAAIDAQARALDAFAIDGIHHNVPFLSALMRHPRWRAGQLATTLIAEEFNGGFPPPEPTGPTARKLTAVAAAIWQLPADRQYNVSGATRASFPSSAERERVVLLGALRFDVVIEQGSDAVTVRFAGDGSRRDGTIAVVSQWRPGEPVWHGGPSMASRSPCRCERCRMAWRSRTRAPPLWRVSIRAARRRLQR